MRLNVNNNQLYQLNSGSSPLCSKPRRKFVQTSHALKSQFISLTFVADTKSHAHSVMHSQLRKPQHTYVKCAVSKAHFNLNWALKVIPGHHYLCRQEPKKACYRNVPLMPKLFLKLKKIWQRENRTNSSISTTPHRFEDVPARNAFEYLQMIYIARNKSY